MNKYVKISIVVLCFFSQELFSQPTISSSIDAVDLVCPNQMVEYKVSYPTGTRQCSVTWSFESGSGHYLSGYSSTSNPTRVTWDETKPNKVKISVDVKYRASGGTCTSPQTETLTFTHILRTVFQENIPNVGTLPAIPLCSTNSVGLIVGHLYIKNTGGVGQPPLTEVDYNWNLPDGWAEYGTGNTGSITSSLNFLTIVPTSSKGGTVSVKGYVNTSSCTGTSPSNTASIVINRTPTVSITPPTGYSGAACGVVDPITFSVNTVSCATNYEWILPQGWSGTSTTNIITITPSGSGGGQLKSIITLDIGTTVERIYNISFINSIANPTISSNNNNSEICNGESYEYICTPPIGYPIYYGFDWYATGGLLINGVSYSLANPFHTTSNSVTVLANSGSFETGSVFVRLNSNPTCNPSSYVHLSKQVGPISSSQFSISGPSSLCPNTSEWYLSSYIDPSITIYQWSWSSGFTSQSGQGTPYLGVTSATNFSGGSITLRIGNRCGLTGSPVIKYVSAASCLGGNNFIVSPNPANTTLTITEQSELENEQSNLTETLDAKIALVNSRSQTLMTGTLNKRTLELDVSKIPSDTYILRIILKDKIITKQVMILH